MSTTVIASIVSIASIIFPWLGVEFDSEQFTNLIQGLVIIGSAIWVWRERVKRGDVTPLGIKR